jgi:hypothetical protein
MHQITPPNKNSFQHRFPKSNPNQRNDLALAGLIVSIAACFLWVFLGWPIWFLGLGLNIAGILKKPKKLAIIGMAISLSSFIIFFFLLFSFVAIMFALISLITLPLTLIGG